MEFKDILKNLRKARGYSQIELAGKLGVSPGLIGRCVGVYHNR